MFFHEKNLILLITLLFLQLPVYAFGDPKPPSEFFELYDNEKTRKVVEIYFSGLVLGVTWSNTLNNRLGKTTVFCFPSNKAITAEEGYLVYKNEYLSNQETWDGMPFQPAGLILTIGLQSQYPC